MLIYKLQFCTEFNSSSLQEIRNKAKSLSPLVSNPFSSVRRRNIKSGPSFVTRVGQIELVFSQVTPRRVLKKRLWDFTAICASSVCLKKIVWFVRNILSCWLVCSVLVKNYFFFFGKVRKSEILQMFKFFDFVAVFRKWRIRQSFH